MHDAECVRFLDDWIDGVAFFFRCQVVVVLSVQRRLSSGRRAGPLTRPAARVWRVLSDESAVMYRGGGEFVSRLDHTSVD